MARSADRIAKPRQDRAVYVISVAAELTGVHPQTLRMYERKGLLSPKRTSGNSRRYSDSDVEWVRQIQRLTQNEGINLAGVRMVMEMQQRIEQIQAQLERARRRAFQSERSSTWGTLVRLRDAQSVFDRSSQRGR